MVVLSDLGSGGAQRVACALVGHWLASARKVAVVTLAPPERDFFKLPATAQRASIGLDRESRSLLGGLVNNARRVWRLRRLLKTMRPAVAVGFVGPTAALLVAAAAGTGVRTIAAERNDPARQSFGPVWDWLRNAAYRHADCVTVNSDGALETLKRMLPPERLAFTPNPVPAVSEGPHAALHGPAILAVGRLHRQKGLDVLLEAFACARAGDWQLYLVGEGSDHAKLEAQARTLGVSERVHFKGVTADPAPYYRAADMFVLPSRHEGTPNALMEAMAYGLPVIVSDASPGPLAVVQDGINGLVTSAEDVAALTRALERLMEDAGFRGRLGAAACETMKARRASDEALDRWDAVVGFSRAGLAR